MEARMAEACTGLNPQGAIGVFDSGVGGLTVFRELARLMPEEDLVYLGDTARVPYGTRSPETIRRYVLEDARFLVSQGVKLLVVACHTSSAVALEELRRRVEVPVVGVIEPGVRRALQLTRGRVGVIGTPATVRSAAYPRLIRRLRPEVRVISRACPLFVPLAEEGWMNDGAGAREVVRRVAELYLDELRRHRVDTLILGCTHYPLLREAIGAVMGPEVALVDASGETAREAQAVLERRGARRSSSPVRGRRRFFVTDDPGRFRRVAERFLGSALGEVRLARL